MPDYFDIACNFTSQEFINKTDAIIKESENHGVKSSWLFHQQSQISRLLQN